METITEDEAKARLRSMTAAEQKPALSEPELESLLALSRIPDEYGLLPSDFGWTGTWDLARGAAEGWRWKAGKVAGAFDVKGAGGELTRSQANAMCRAMVAQYESQILPDDIALASTEEGRYGYPAWVVNL